MVNGDCLSGRKNDEDKVVVMLLVLFQIVESRLSEAGVIRVLLRLQGSTSLPPVHHSSWDNAASRLSCFQQQSYSSVERRARNCDSSDNDDDDDEEEQVESPLLV